MDHNWDLLDCWEDLLQGSSKEQINEEVEKQRCFRRNANSFGKWAELIRITWVDLLRYNKWLCLSLFFFESLAVLSCEVLLADKQDFQLVFPLSDWNILDISEVQDEIQVVWVEVNALPSEFKLSEIWVKPCNHSEINDWHVCVINIYKASVYDLQRLIQLITCICCGLFELMTQFSSFFRANASIRAVLLHILISFEFRESSECGQQNWSRNSNS